MRCAIYTRISKDPTGSLAGVTRQETECRALVERLGGEVSVVLSDNDVSAYSGKKRPGYEELLRLIDARAIDAVVVWHTDRLYRRMGDLERYIAVCQPANVPTHSVQAGPLDLATPSGRMIARQLGAVAQYESEQKGERHRAANRQRVLQGKHFGTRRCFGYSPDGLVILEEEASALRDAFGWVLDGVALREIARRWNAAGHRTPQKGNEWTGDVLRRTLQTPRLAGLVKYKGEILPGVQAEWPAIVDVDTWQAVQAVFANPARRTTPNHWAPLLLSGVAVCDQCGAAIQSGGTRNGRARLRCSKMGGHVYREAGPIEDLVERAIVRRLEQPDALSAFVRKGSGVDVPRIRAEIEVLLKRQEAMAEAFADGDVTLAQLKASNERTTARIADLEAKIPAAVPPSLRALASAPDVEAAWAGLDLEAKRQVIRILAEVRIKAPGTKENAYIDWRQRIINPETVVIRFH